MDLLDYYRGELSARRLGVLVQQLPADSALSRALNGGEQPWQRIENLIADLWALLAKKEHPRRAELIEEKRRTEKLAKVIELKTIYETRKQSYGVG